MQYFASLTRSLFRNVSYFSAYKVLPESFPNEVGVMTSMKSMIVSADYGGGDIPDVRYQLPNLESYDVKTSSSSGPPPPDTPVTTDDNQAVDGTFSPPQQPQQGQQQPSSSSTSSSGDSSIRSSPFYTALAVSAVTNLIFLL